MFGRSGSFVLLLFVIFPFAIFSATLHAVSISGKVRSSVHNEPLARVEVSVREAQRSATTGDDGAFRFDDLAPGTYTLRVNAVGYRLVTVPFRIAQDEAVPEFQIVLAPDNLRLSEKVEVKGDLFQGPDSPATLEMNLTGPEVRETATVLVNDPFRSVQALPGVTAAGNNDFFAQFSVMGASYEDTSVYLDGILLPSPFHGTEITQGATLSILTSETLDDIRLLPAAYPEKYGDAVGAALDLETREGSRSRPAFRISAGLADTEALGEGELGKTKRGSWIASGRKSYLGYLFRNQLADTSDDVSFYDESLKLAYDLTPRQSGTFYGIGGHTVYKLTNQLANQALGDPNQIEQATDDFSMARAGWRFTASPRFLVEAHGAYLTDPSETKNIDQGSLLNAHHAEWVAAGSAVWSWSREQVVEGGWMSRRVNDSVARAYYGAAAPAFSSAESGRGWKQDGYLQQTASLFNNRLHLLGSLRVDTATLFDAHPVAPQISAAWQLASATQLQVGYGRYHQFTFPADRLVPFPATCGFSQEELQRADHYTAAVEQRIGEHTRAKLLVFDRQNTELFDESVSAPCESDGSHGFRPFEHDSSRGAQLVLQSRTANKLSGWVGYTLVYARARDVFGGGAMIVPSPLFPTLEDQRHAVNTFVNYRLTPTINVGGKFLYGSGFPVPSDYNQLRLGDYQRLDVRAEKDWAFGRWKLSLYGELLNVTDHGNPRYFYTTYDVNGNLSAATGKGLPITPTAGVAVAF